MCVRVDDGVLQDVDGPGHVSREDALCPARQPVGLCQQTPRQQVVAGGDLAVQDVLREDMGADTHNTDTVNIQYVCVYIYLCEDQFEF